MSAPEVIEIPKLSPGATDAGSIPPFDNLEETGAPETDSRGRKRDYAAEHAKRKARRLAGDNGEGGPRRRRGRPSNAERAARGDAPHQEVHAGELPPEPGTMSPDEEKAFADMLALAFRLSSQLIAAKRGPHWIMDQKESELHGAAWSAALAPWAGSLGKWLPLATASALLVSAIATRVSQDATMAATPPQEPKSETAPVVGLVR